MGAFPLWRLTKNYVNKGGDKSVHFETWMNVHVHVCIIFIFFFFFSVFCLYVCQSVHWSFYMTICLQPDPPGSRTIIVLKDQNFFQEDIQLGKNLSHVLTLAVLYHTMPHTPCRFEVKDVHGLQCFVSMQFWRKRVCFSSSVCTLKNC